jgi:hypothetical protein
LYRQLVCLVGACKRIARRYCTAVSFEVAMKER